MMNESVPSNSAQPDTKQSTSAKRPKPPVVLGRLGLSRRATGRVYAFATATWHLVAEANGGNVDALAAKRIITATLAYAEAARAQGRLADAAAGRITLTEEQTAAWSDRVGRNHDRCDRILATLGIAPLGPADFFDPRNPNGLYGTPAPAPSAPRVTEAGDNAACAKPEAHVAIPPDLDQQEGD